MKKLFMIVSLGVLFSLPTPIWASCSDRENVKLKNIAGNVNIAYVFKEESGTFDLVFSNVRSEVYIKTPSGGILSGAGDIVSGGYAPSGSYGFKIYTSSANCPNKILMTKYITTPSYNPLYNRDVCKGAEEYKYCQKWVKNPYNESEFDKVVSEYKENKNKEIVNEKEKKVMGFYDYLADFYSKYYYFLLPIVIIICVVVIMKRKKKEEFF